MFARRLYWFTIVMGVLAATVVIRLVDIQLVHAAEYEGLADRLLTQTVINLRPPRGDIVDREGRILVSDEPTWDIGVKYDVIAGRRDYLISAARQLKRDGRLPRSLSDADAADRLQIDVAEMWKTLTTLSGQSAEMIADRCDEIVRRVERIREQRERRSGIVERVREEEWYHTVAGGISDQLALSLRLEFEGRYPWLAIIPSSRRVGHDVDSLAHVLGRLGAASPERIERDPLGADELRRLKPDDLCGVSGVELLGETILRGTRGQVVKDFGRREIERIEPQRGGQLRLSVDADLQNFAYAALKEAVDASESPAGGSVVVIDAHTREVLALVGYPTYSYDRYREEYPRLAREMRWSPLLFRPVQGQYPPGSTCKAVTLIGGLVDGVVDPQTRIHCTGHLLPNNPKMFRCWIYNQHGLTHDLRGNPAGQDADDAIRNSCNIYFFRVGEKLGAERLCEWFRKCGMGRVTGTGLIEESAAIVPDAAYLARAQAREHQPSDAWNFSIGQGEVTATPLQSANFAATIATGEVAPVRLVLNEGFETDAARQFPRATLDPAALRVLRSGMWRVVNERGGTGDYAKLATPGYVLCGKTGSAQTVPRVLNHDFIFDWPDGRRETIRAVNEADAEAALRAAHPELGADAGDGEAEAVVTPPRRPRLVGKFAGDRFPDIGPDDKLPSHAWFIGFTQAADTPRGDAPRGRAYAVSVLIEFGGSGGHVASPVAKKVLEHLLAREDPAP